MAPEPVKSRALPDPLIPPSGGGTDGAAADVRIPAGRAPEGMRGLAKGLAVIEAFGPERSQLTVTDAARATGSTPAAARRCLLTLADLGYLTYDGKYFRPTPRMLRLGGAYLETAPLPTLAQPYLTSARDVLGESVSLAVLEDDSSVFVARAEAQRIVSTGVRVGARLPAFCSATGRVLLAGLDEAELDRRLATAGLRARTPYTVVDPARIRVLVQRVRVDGYAATDEELELGMRSLAVPVRDARGRTVAALSVSAFSARVTGEELRRSFPPVLADHAARLGQCL